MSHNWHQTIERVGGFNYLVRDVTIEVGKDTLNDTDISKDVRHYTMIPERVNEQNHWSLGTEILDWIFDIIEYCIFEIMIESSDLGFLGSATVVQDSNI